MSIVKVDAIQNTSGVEVYTTKAWINFNGQFTVSIREDGNVSSIIDNGTGDYSVYFTSAISTSNYATMTGTVGLSSGAHPVTACSVNEGMLASTSSVRVLTGATGGSGVTGFQFDVEGVYLAINA